MFGGTKITALLSSKPSNCGSVWMSGITSSIIIDSSRRLIHLYVADFKANSWTVSLICGEMSTHIHMCTRTHAHVHTRTIV